MGLHFWSNLNCKLHIHRNPPIMRMSVSAHYGEVDLSSGVKKVIGSTCSKTGHLEQPVYHFLGLGYQKKVHNVTRVTCSRNFESVYRSIVMIFLWHSPTIHILTQSDLFSQIHM